jgi:hypothetical protein
MSIEGMFRKGMVLATTILLSSGCAQVAVPVGNGPPPAWIICHKGKKTLELPAPAARGHLSHGDTPGPCP